MEFFGINLIDLLKTVGYVGLLGIIFAETGLFMGFFFPGDSLLFVAGLLAAQGFFNLFLLNLVIFIGAVTGNMAGYWFGSRVGPALFRREDSLIFKKRHLLTAQAYYEEHGGKTIFLARFIPIVRTFAPIVAGIGRMPYRTFMFYNLVGGFVWSVGLTVLGYLLGNVVPDIDRYLLPIVLLIIVISFIPAVLHYLKEKRRTTPVPSLAAVAVEED